MSDTPAPSPTPDPDPTPDAPDDPKPTETVEFWKQKAREQEKRAKENADARKRLDELEAANKSEVEKANDAKAAAEKDAADARAEALRLRVAAKHGISDEDADLFLTGTDEDTLTKQAERLSKHASDRKKNGNVVPREGSTPTKPGTDDMREFTRALFSGATE